MLHPGDKFGRWTVLGEDHKNRGIQYYKCQCSCAKKTIKAVNEYNLRSGSSKSCGCIREEMWASKEHRDQVRKMAQVTRKHTFCKNCGAPHYAKGLCRNCYEKQRRGRDLREYAYPTNLLLEMGLILPNITQSTKKRLAQFLETGVITDRQKNAIIKYYRDRKTYDAIGKEMGGITREAVRVIINKGMDVLRNVDTLDYVLGLTSYYNRIGELKAQIKRLEYLRDSAINSFEVPDTYIADTNDKSIYISQREYSEKTGIPIRNISVWCSKNQIDHIKVGHKNLVKKDAVPNLKHRSKWSTYNKGGN